MKKKVGIIPILLIIIICLATGYYFGYMKPVPYISSLLPKPAAAETSAPVIREPYSVEVDLSKPILEQSARTKLLTVKTQKISAAGEIKEAGLFNWAVFSKTKAVVYHGLATFSVDLGTIGEDDISINTDTKTIDIHIGKPSLNIEYLPEETEFFSTSNGLLTFGEMDITPEMNAELETSAKELLYEAVSADDVAKHEAEKFAELSVQEIFEPVVTAAADAAVAELNDPFAVPVYYTVKVIIDG